MNTLLIPTALDAGPLRLQVDTHEPLNMDGMPIAWHPFESDVYPRDCRHCPLPVYNRVHVGFRKQTSFHEFSRVAT